jgi:hypothetical protein
MELHLQSPMRVMNCCLIKFWNNFMPLLLLLLIFFNLFLLLLISPFLFSFLFLLLTQLILLHILPFIFSSVSTHATVHSGSDRAILIQSTSVHIDTVSLMWHADPLLGNYHEISKYAAAVAE